MKISKEAKDYVEALFSKELDTAQSILDLQLKSTSSQVAFKNQAHETNIRHKIEYIERLITRVVDLYIQVYRGEWQIITQAEHDEMSFRCACSAIGASPPKAHSTQIDLAGREPAANRYGLGDASSTYRRRTA